MYVPAHFQEHRLSVLHEVIEHTGLATLVSLGPNGMDASHVPMLLERETGPFGTLYGHIARANPQWVDATSELPALAIFLGPNAYVSPSWYPSKQRTGQVVPTWNYVAVHARGPVRFFDSPERLLALVTRLTEAHEGGRQHPWAVSDAPAEYIRAHLKSIIGFELAIASIQGKWKMSQNRSAEDRRGVADGLGREGTASALNVAAMVKGLSSPS